MTGKNATWSQRNNELGLNAIPFTPGRYANAVQKNALFRHAFQVVREDETSSFVLNLEPDGSATLCRGWRYLYFNDGPEVHTSENIREQLGYRGSWAQRDEWIYLNVAINDGVCPRIGEYSHLIPDHAHEWQLRCLPISLKDSCKFNTPVLACQTTNVEPEFGEDEPHVVPRILPGSWIMLGGGNGLRIRIEAKGVRGKTVPAVNLELSPEPVEVHTWQHPF
jgi:hypothetical protein